MAKKLLKNLFREKFLVYLNPDQPNENSAENVEIAENIKEVGKILQNQEKIKNTLPATGTVDSDDPVSGLRILIGSFAGDLSDKHEQQSILKKIFEQSVDTNFSGIDRENIGKIEIKKIWEDNQVKYFCRVTSKTNRFMNSIKLPLLPPALSEIAKRKEMAKEKTTEMLRDYSEVISRPLIEDNKGEESGIEEPPATEKPESEKTAAEQEETTKNKAKEQQKKTITLIDQSTSRNPLVKESTRTGNEFLIKLENGLPNIEITYKDNVAFVKRYRFPINDVEIDTITKLKNPYEISDSLAKIIDKSYRERLEYDKYGKNLNLETFDIAGLDQDFRIPEPIASFSDEDWQKNFQNFNNKEIYEKLLSPPFNKSGNNVVDTLRNIVQENDNDLVDFEHVLEHTQAYEGFDREDFQDEIKKLKADSDPKSIAKLRKLYDIYINSMKLMLTLANESLSGEKKSATAYEKYESTVQKAETTTEKAADNYPLSNFLNEPGADKYKITISDEAFQKLSEEIQKYPGQSAPDKQSAIKFALNQGLSLNELIAHGVVKKDSEGNLMITGDKFEESITDYQQALQDGLTKEFQKDQESTEPNFLFKWLSSGTEMENRTTKGMGQAYYETGHDLWNYTSPEALSAQLLDKQQVEIETNGKKETINLYKTEKGVRIYDKEAVTKYRNYLMERGVKFKKASEKLAERSYVFDEMIFKKIELNKKQENIDKFLKTPTIETWKAIPGHEGINAVLTGEPFNLPEDRIPEKMHTLIKDHTRQQGDKITFTHIIEDLLLAKINESYKSKNPYRDQLSNYGRDTNKIGTSKNLYDEYRNLRLELGNLNQKENLSDKEQTQKADILARFDQLNVYIDGAAILAQRLEKLGVVEPTIDEQLQKIHTEQDLLRLAAAPEQMDALKWGALSEIRREEADQMMRVEEGLEADYSDKPQIREIQKSLKEAGYPLNKIGEVEKKLLAIGILNFEADKLKSGGAVIPVDLGNGFSIAFTAIGGKDGGAFNTTITYQLFKNEQRSGTVAAGAGVGLENGKIGPTANLAYVHTEKISPGTNMEISAGLILAGTSLIAGGGLFFRYDEKADIKFTYNRTREIGAYSQIDNLLEQGKIGEALTEIKQHPTFKEFAAQLDDQDLLVTYRVHQEQSLKQAFKETSDQIIYSAGFAAGVDVITGMPVIFAGIEFKIGEVTLVLPKIGQRERMAKSLSALEIDKQLENQLKDRAEGKERIIFYKEGSPELYRTADGNLGILAEKETADFDNLESNLDELRKKLAPLNMDVKIAVMEMDGKPRKFLELFVNETENRNTSIYLDHDIQQMLIVGENGRMLLPGNLDGLTVTRETFKFPAPLYQKGDATMEDIIVIGKNGGFDRDRVISTSNKVLKKTTQNGAESAWIIENGAGTEYNARITTPEEFNNLTTPATRAQFAEFTESIGGLSTEEFADVMQDVNEAQRIFNGITKDQLDTMEVGEEFPQQIDEVYNKMKKDIEGGNPPIYDAPAIIAGAQKEFGDHLNAKETGILYNRFLENYFIDIWTRGGKKEVLNRFEKNNEKITNSILIPRFKDKIAKLGIEPPQGMSVEDYAKRLAEKVQTASKESFNKVLEDIDEKELTAKIKAGDTAEIRKILGSLATPIENPEKYLFASSSTVRGTKEGIIVTTPLSVGMPTGILGEKSEWQIGSKDKESSDLAKILLDTVSPAPGEKLDLETLTSPLVIKTFTSAAGRLQLGDTDYGIIKDFYKLSEEAKSTIVNNPDKYPISNKALKSLTKFATEIRQAMLEGKKELPLSNNAKLLLGTPDIKTGPYAVCGNFSIITAEDFTVILEKDGKYFAAKASTQVIPEVNHHKEAITLGIGASVTLPKETPPQTPEEVEVTPNPEGEVEVRPVGATEPGGTPPAPSADVSNSPTGSIKNIE